MTEEWKKIEGYPNYSVSNLGKVRNDNTGRILRPCKTGAKGRVDNKYYQVVLRQGVAKHFLVHRLVANAFVPNPEGKGYVNHINGDKFHNAADNLEWCSYSENLVHSYYVLNNKMGFEGGPKKVVRIEDGRVFNSVNEAARACGLKGAGNIPRCIRGGRPTSGGYHWKYAEGEL